MRHTHATIALLFLASTTAAAAPDEVAARFERAQALHAAGRCDQAEPLLVEIATAHPDHPTAALAANRLLDCLASARRLDELGRRLEQLCVVPQLRRNPVMADTCVKTRTVLDYLRAEELARARRHEEAAAAYAALAEKRRGDPMHAELLYNAAMLNVRAGLRDLAATQLQSLVAWNEARAARGIGRHRLAANALRMLGEHALVTARYPEAAGLLERYAERFGGERDAPDALLTAAGLREALGDDTRALEDLRTFERFYGRGSRGNWPGPRRVAEAVFHMGSILERRERPLKVAEHYRRYLKEWSRPGGPTLEVAARVKLAEALWRASCPVGGVDGQCVTIAPKPSPCGPRRVTVHARKAALAREVQGLLRGVIASWGRGSPDRDPRVSAAVARSRFLVAEAEHEALLAGDRNESTGSVAERYSDTIKQRDAMWAVAALARMGQLEAAVADRIRATAKGKGACRAAEAAADPHRTKAREVFARCLQTAREVSIYDEWRAACARGAGEEAPPDIAPRPGFFSLQPAAAAATIQTAR